MAKAARAIIIEDGKILTMFRNKEGSKYYTLVGGRVGDDESLEAGVTREVKEETGLDVIDGRLLYIEEHAAPYNEQYIFLCKIAPHDTIALQEYSEEAFLNRLNTNIHEPQWVQTEAFARLPFRTPQLQEAIVKALKKGWPKEPVKL